jgi:hypothetical protein
VSGGYYWLRRTALRVVSIPHFALDKLCVCVCVCVFWGGGNMIAKESFPVALQVGVCLH